MQALALVEGLGFLGEDGRIALPLQSFTRFHQLGFQRRLLFGLHCGHLFLRSEPGVFCARHLRHQLGELGLRLRLGGLLDLGPHRGELRLRLSSCLGHGFPLGPF